MHLIPTDPSRHTTYSVTFKMSSKKKKRCTNNYINGRNQQISIRNELFDGIKKQKPFFDLLQTSRKSYTAEGNQFALRCADAILGFRLEQKKYVSPILTNQKINDCWKSSRFSRTHDLYSPITICVQARTPKAYRFLFSNLIALGDAAFGQDDPTQRRYLLWR